MALRSHSSSQNILQSLQKWKDVVDLMDMTIDREFWMFVEACTPLAIDASINLKDSFRMVGGVTCCAPSK